MHKRRGALIIAAAVVSVMLLIYATLRAQATKTADRDIDAFFRDFAQSDAALIEKHFSYLAQRREVADAIISRHKDAIRNFNYSQITPSLNLMLNRAVVEVSWHLNVVFRKRADGWYVLSFDEFVADPKNA